MTFKIKDGISIAGSTFVDSSRNVTANTLSSAVATGTAPLTITSTTKVTNLNAEMVDGAHTDTAYNSFGNGTIPIRHSSGYLFSNYFNMTADVTTTSPSHLAVATGSDGYLRWQTPAQFKTNISLNNVENTALSTWAGSANITTLGTITTGTWTGTAIAIANGGTGATTAATARTNLGATTLGANLFTLANPSAITFPRINADNTVSTLDAATFRTAIGAGTSSTTGTVTSVGGTGTVSGLTLTGTVTSTGNLTLGGTLSVAASNFASQTANTVLAAPSGAAGAPTFRALVAADIPALSYAPTAGSTSITTLGTVTTGTWSATAIGATKGGTGLTAISALSIPVANTANTYTTVTPAAGQSVRVNAGGTAWEAYTPGTGTGTVTSVGGTGTVSGLSLSGTVTSTGNLTLSGTLSVSIDNISDEHRIFNNMGVNHATRTAFDAQGVAATVNFGNNFVQGSTNGPGTNSAGQYYTQFLGLGNDYAYNTYGMQIAYPRNVTSPYISIRYEEGGVFAAWQKISAGYADTAGSATSATTLQTARTLTIGSTGKTFNGSADVTWTLAEIGASPTAGSANITTLGTITTGIWTGTTIAVANGGTGATSAASARTNLGATTLGANLFTLTNPSAVTFPRFNADNTVSTLDAATFRTAIGAGVGTVTSVTATSPVASSGGATPNISMAAATSSVNGYMTSTYAAKLDGIAAGATAFAGATITDDTTTNASRYIVWEDVSSGTSTTVGVSSTKLYFNPSTGTLNATVFNSLSDGTQKENIVPIKNALNTISSITGVEFDWASNNKHSAGVVAQQLESILPFLVDTNDSGIKSVNYSGIIAYLIQAIKELSQEVKQSNYK